MDTLISDRRPTAADKRGSVLIFVLGILLLLAIVATAFLGTSRSDRTATQQNANNTQVDLLLEGVVNAAKGQIVGDETVPGGSVPENWDAITYSDGSLGPATNDNWLASRVPTTEDPNSVYAGNLLNNGGNNPCWWLGISAPVLGDAHFETPYVPSGMTTPQYTARNRIQPTYVNFSGQNWPAMIVGGTAYLAADADGDGVADSGLFRIPVGQLSGLTYFGAVRIVDNNSAINLNTAMSKTFSFDGTGKGTLLASNNPADPKLAGAFVSDIGLAEILRSWSFSSNSPQFDKMSSLQFSATVDEWQLLNKYRFGTTVVPVRPSGVVNITTSDNEPYDETSTGSATMVGNRADFQFSSIGDALESQLGRRPNNPGETETGSAQNAKSSFVDSLMFTERFSIANASDMDSTAVPPTSSNDIINALPFSLEKGPSGFVNTQPYNGIGTTGVDAWFTQNFDYLSEDLSTAVTYSNTAMNRRTILTGVSGTGNQVTTSITPPDYLYNLLSPSSGQWSGTGTTTGTGTGTTTPLVTRNKNAYTEYNVNPLSSTLQLPMYIASLNNVSGSASSTVDPKISINQGRFEELFYGFFKVMAHSGFTGMADDAGTPFSLLYNGNGLGGTNNAFSQRSTVNFDATQGNYAANGVYYRDPYIGMRFTPSTEAALTFPDRLEPPGLASVVNGQTSTSTPPAAEQNPLRMFRSVLRAAHDRGAAATPPATTGYWNNNTTRLPADQVLVLRAAIAAANLEALRDSSENSASGNFNARTLMHDIPLTGVVNGVAVPIVAHVFGLRSQPFITEIYADSFAGADTLGTNPEGYVAIKLYNPTGVTISLKYCRLVGLRRYIDATMPATTPPTTQYPEMQVLDLQTPLPAWSVPDAEDNNPAYNQIDLGTAASNVKGATTYKGYEIPPNGTLVLENYSGGGSGSPTPLADDASHRPASSGLPDTLGIPPATTQVNFAYVPGLERVVWDRDLVLMRPTNCTPPVTTTTPQNVLEYTYPDPANVPLSVSHMVPLDSFDFTGLKVAGGIVPGNGRAGEWHYVRSVSAAKPWQWVYPGRYDGDQSIVVAGSTPRPRQQGTQEAFGTDGLVGFATTDTDPWSDPANANNPTKPVMSLNGDPATATIALYPDVFTIQLNMPGWPSDNSLHNYTSGGNSIPNRFPFGGFRRLADMLQAPFIGSYTIQTESDIVNNVDSFLEINPVTMDSALAEDTDTNDNEKATDNGTQSREQIGRFVPLRPSIGGTANNGTPAVDTPSTDTPPIIAQDFDPSFNTSGSNPAALDPLRYRDDVADIDSNPLPVSGSPNPDNLYDRLNRYAFASALFDHFTLNAPQDDYTANYPTQFPWQPDTAYSMGDTVQFGQNIYVCLAIHTSANTVASADQLDPGTAADPSTNPATYAVTPVATATWLPLPRNQVSNSDANPGSRSDLVASNGAAFNYKISDDANEATESIQGMININTAPEKVLAMVPWVPSNVPIGDGLAFTTSSYPATVSLGADANPTDDNAQIAHAIVGYRDGVYHAVNPPTNDLNITTQSTMHAHAKMPFVTLFDLYKVPEFRQAQSQILSMMNPNAAYWQSLGLYSLSHVARYDFEEQTLLLNRISNLVTTKSDTYTIYALVQGWRNVGTDHPTLVVQRRAAIIVDRSGATATTKTLTTLSRVPTQ